MCSAAAFVVVVVVVVVTVVDMPRFVLVEVVGILVQPEG